MAVVFDESKLLRGDEDFVKIITKVLDGAPTDVVSLTSNDILTYGTKHSNWGISSSSTEVKFCTQAKSTKFAGQSSYKDITIEEGMTSETEDLLEEIQSNKSIVLVAQVSKDNKVISCFYGQILDIDFKLIGETVGVATTQYAILGKAKATYTDAQGV